MVDRTYLLSRSKLFDSALLLKAKGTVVTSMVGENPIGTDKYIDVGNGHCRGDVIINVYSLPVTRASMYFSMRLQGGMSANFTSMTDLQIIEVGTNEMLSSDIDRATGRYVQPFSNCFDGIMYRYLRHYITASTLGATGVQYEVYLSSIDG